MSGRKQGDGDYPQRMRQEAVGYLARELSSADRQRLYSGSVSDRAALFKRGRGTNPHLDQAYHKFRTADWSPFDWAPRAQALSRAAFRRICIRWGQRSVQASNCCASKRKRSRPLSAEEIRELAVLLATPGRDQYSVVYWRDIDDALKRHPQRARIAQLVARNGTKTETLQKRVLDAHPELLTRKQIDLAEQHVAATAAARKLQADVWAQRVPWLVKELRPGGGGYMWRRWDPKCDDPTTPEHGQHFIYHGERWRKFYRDFTFVIDATTITNQESPAKERTKGLVPVQEVHEPELMRTSKAVGSIDSVMYYIMICSDGLVAGPCITHHGSSKTSQGKEHPQKHEEAFPTWCAPSGCIYQG